MLKKIIQDEVLNENLKGAPLPFRIFLQDNLNIINRLQLSAKNESGVLSEAWVGGFNDLASFIQEFQIYVRNYMYDSDSFQLGLIVLEGKHDYLEEVFKGVKSDLSRSKQQELAVYFKSLKQLISQFEEWLLGR